MVKLAQRESWEYKMQARNTCKLDPTLNGFFDEASNLGNVLLTGHTVLQNYLLKNYFVKTFREIVKRD